MNSICDYKGTWSVCLTDENGEQELYINGTGNTFTEAMQNMWIKMDYPLAECKDFHNIVLAGYYEVPNECKDFEFAVKDAMAFDTMLHYCFAKGKAKVEDVMECAFKDTAYSDIPLSAFTVGSQYRMAV